MTESNSIWPTFTDWFKLNSRHQYDLLNPGASDEDINKLQNIIGQQLPDEVVETYKANNGSDKSKASIFFGYQFFDIEGIIANWNTWQDVAAQDDWHEYDNQHSSTPEGAIQTTYITKGWIPILHDWSGNHVGVDLNPGPNGTKGQVINFGRDDNAKFVFANSWNEFLEYLLKKLESGQFAVSQENTIDLTDGNKAIHLVDGLKAELFPESVNQPVKKIAQPTQIDEEELKSLILAQIKASPVPLNCYELMKLIEQSGKPMFISRINLLCKKMVAQGSLLEVKKLGTDYFSVA